MFGFLFDNHVAAQFLAAIRPGSPPTPSAKSWARRDMTTEVGTLLAALPMHGPDGPQDVRNSPPGYAEAVDANLERELFGVASPGMRRTMPVPDGGQPDEGFPAGLLLKATVQGLSIVEGPEPLRE